MTSQELNNHLVSKKAGFNYTYVINNKKYSIDEFDNQKGWCLTINELNQGHPALGEYILKSSYGHRGLKLRECKLMITQDCLDSQI